MSYMIFVQFFQNENDKKVPRDVIAECFGSAFHYKDEEAWFVYAENEFPELYGEFQNSELSSFSVSSPPISQSFWDSLVKILKIEGAVLLLPGFEGIVISNNDTGKHLPSDMKAALSNLVNVSNSQQIIDILKNA